MDSDEKILAHVISVWRESKKMLAIGGREGMLFLTDRHLCFVHKTEAKMKWWQAASQRQILGLLKSDNIMMQHDGYGEKDLINDLVDERNVEVGFDDISKISSKDEVWGSALYVDYTKNGKKEKFQFSVAKGWVKYPVKEPTGKHMKVNWSPIVEYVKEHQKFTK